MDKLLVIVGPTATGKTSLGIHLAKRFNGEIVSADSRQVYRRLDIGTGKELPAGAKFEIGNWKLEIRKKDYNIGYYKIDGVRIWLYDIIKPSQMFSAVEYAELAWRVIRDIWDRGRLPILIGGTGFYIKAVLEGIETTGIEADWELREKLSKLTTEELQNRLREVNLEKYGRMNRSDRNNPRRLIRAIEVSKAGRDPAPEQIRCGAGKVAQLQVKKNFNFLQVGLMVSKGALYQRIDRRVEERVKEGIIEEIAELLRRGYSWDDPGFNTLGYKEWKAYFSRKATKEEVIQSWKYDEHGYARRQLTWFRKDKQIRWYDITESGLIKRVTEDVEKWYDN